VTTILTVLIASLGYLPKNAFPVPGQSLVTEATPPRRSFMFHSIALGVGGTRYISFEERHWHNDCFVCKRCRSSLVGRGFLTEGQDILCPDCGKRDSYHSTETNSYGNGHRSIVNDYHQAN
jgi:hypothetical protein